MPLRFARTIRNGLSHRALVSFETSIGVPKASGERSVAKGDAIVPFTKPRSRWWRYGEWKPGLMDENRRTSVPPAVQFPLLRPFHLLAQFGLHSF